MTVDSDRLDMNDRKKMQSLQKGKESVSPEGDNQHL